MGGVRHSTMILTSGQSAKYKYNPVVIKNVIARKQNLNRLHMCNIKHPNGDICVISGMGYGV